MSFDTDWAPCDRPCFWVSRLVETRALQGYESITVTLLWHRPTGSWFCERGTQVWQDDPTLSILHWDGFLSSVTLCTEAQDAATYFKEETVNDGQVNLMRFKYFQSSTPNLMFTSCFFPSSCSFLANLRLVLFFLDLNCSSFFLFSPLLAQFTCMVYILQIPRSCFHSPS